MPARLLRAPACSLSFCSAAVTDHLCTSAVPRLQNQDLRLILKQYLDGVSVNEEVMAGTNSLLVVNHKLKLNVPVGSRRPAPATIVEAAAVVSDVHRQGVRM